MDYIKIAKWEICVNLKTTLSIGLCQVCIWVQLSQKCGERLLPSSCLSVLPSFPKQQVGSVWTNFHGIWNLSIFRKSVEKIQDLLKSGEIKGRFTWRPMYVSDNICWILLRMRNFQIKFVEKIKKKLCSKTFHENRVVYEIVWKNML